MFFVKKSNFLNVIESSESAHKNSYDQNSIFFSDAWDVFIGDISVTIARPDFLRIFFKTYKNQDIFFSMHFWAYQPRRHLLNIQKWSFFDVVDFSNFFQKKSYIRIYCFLMRTFLQNSEFNRSQNPENLDIFFFMHFWAYQPRRHLFSIQKWSFFDVVDFSKSF